MKTIAVLVVCVCVAGCGSSGLNRPVSEVTAQVAADSVQHVTVTTHSYYFEPNRVVVKRGVPVELTVKNAATFVPHNMSCAGGEAGIVLDAKAGMFHGKKNVRFTPTQVGEYPFFCKVDGHSKKGMTGTIVVVD